MPLDLLLEAAQHQHQQQHQPHADSTAPDATDAELDRPLPELQHQLDRLSSLPFSFSHADDALALRMSAPNKQSSPARGSPFPQRPTRQSSPSGTRYQAGQPLPQPQAQAQAQAQSPLTGEPAYPLPSPITDPFTQFPYNMPAQSSHPPQAGFQHQQHQQQWPLQHPAQFQAGPQGWPHSPTHPGPSAPPQQGGMAHDQFWAEMMRYQGTSPGSLGPSQAGPSHSPHVPLAPLTTTGLGSPTDPPPASGSEDKRRRNTAASARFRIKKKQRMLNLERSVQDLQGRAEELEKETGELRRENGWLREMVLLKGGISAGSVAGAIQRGDVRAGLLGAFAGLGVPSAAGASRGKEVKGKRRKAPEPSDEEDDIEEGLEDSEETETTEEESEEEDKKKARGKGKGKAATTSKKKST